MKPLQWILVLWASLLASAAATVVSTGEARYPVNMGPASDPARIPVASIPCESNHDYGLLDLVSTPFPSIPGGWLWEGGIELNGNLPSAFGISVRPEDSTDPTQGPLTIHLRRQSPPAYSPYSKEQVLLATMRCVLDTVYATPKNPLTINITTEDPADAALVRFSGVYLTRPVGTDEFEETPLPGCITKVDRNGVREIVFTTGAEPAAPSKNPKPLWIPFPIEGDSDPGFILLPTWTGDGLPDDQLALLGRPWPLVQDRYNPSTGNPDGNLLTRQELINAFNVDRTDDQVTLEADMNLSEDWELADGMSLLCWAAVLSEHPTETQPLEIILRMNREMDPRFQSWVADHGWETVEAAGNVGIRTTLVWNPETGSLAKGSIPKYRIDRHSDGGWEVTDREVYERAVRAATEEGVELP